MRHQRRSQPAARAGQLAVALLEVAQGREHHVRVADPGQLAGRVAEAGVLGAVDAVAELAAHEPQQRAQLLHVLARLVHRLLARAVRLAAQLVERVVDAPAPRRTVEEPCRIEAEAARGHASSLPP